MSLSVLGRPKLDSVQMSPHKLPHGGEELLSVSLWSHSCQCSPACGQPFSLQAHSLAHAQLIRRVLSCKAALWAGRTQLVPQHRVTPCQVQHSGELQGVPANLPAEFPPRDSPALQHWELLPSLVSPASFLRIHSCPGQ